MSALKPGTMDNQFTFGSQNPDPVQKISFGPWFRRSSAFHAMVLTQSRCLQGRLVLAVGSLLQHADAIIKPRHF